MQITIVNTTKVVDVNGVPARVWEGKTDSGIEIQCLITRVAVHNSQDCSQFETELAEQRAPSLPAEVFPMRMIL